MLMGHVKRSYRQYRDSNDHLPQCMKDFSDRCEIFDAMKALTDDAGMPEECQLSSMHAHIFTVDVFLWFMARHGYTLQRSRAHVEFDDLDQARQNVRDERLRRLERLINSTKAPQES